ncbi:phospho-sugar mutase [Ihubacter sp. rT4E-8]|uniref:phospho-sugar mutase n=1 Tax=Ihubacter sp. rT4E-8 TaxID=3242369 RepID=UPI003CF43905
MMDKKQIREFAITEYRRWLTCATDPKAQNELKNLAGQEEELVDAFCAHLRFGTSGIRGVLGIGINRMNEYVIRRTTQGVANYLNRICSHRPRVVISYDSRDKSDVFAMETAKVLRGNDVEVHLFPHLAPVSVLSYSIRKLSCDMGIMITASHNPKIFNGYKVYGSDGYQIVGDVPDAILEEIDKLDFFDGIREDHSGIQFVSDEVSKNFCRDVIAMSTADGILGNQMNELSVVYTPLNGTGNHYVRQVLDGIGFNNLTVVGCQEMPDSSFSTCPAPNPEKITAYNEGFKALDAVKGDIIIATDPDCDRVGVSIYHDSMKVLLTGNQLGVLMLDYLCHVRPPKPGQFMIKSIVTTPLAERIAEKYGLRTVNTLTGFKYIGEMITSLEQAGRLSEYYFGFEESNGYLMNPFIRDKDGVSSAMLAVEVAAWCKAAGKDLIQRLHEIYEEFGVCRDKTWNFFFEGPYGSLTMGHVMDWFRNNLTAGSSIGGVMIQERIDYLQDTGLPKSDVMSYLLEGGTQLVIRPSGTEAKIKIYIFETENLPTVEKDIENIMNSFKG